MIFTSKGQQTILIVKKPNLKLAWLNEYREIVTIITYPIRMLSTFDGLCNLR